MGREVSAEWGFDSISEPKREKAMSVRSFLVRCLKASTSSVFPTRTLNLNAKKTWMMIPTDANMFVFRNRWLFLAISHRSSSWKLTHMLSNMNRCCELHLLYDSSRAKEMFYSSIVRVLEGQRMERRRNRRVIGGKTKKLISYPNNNEARKRRQKCLSCGKLIQFSHFVRSVIRLKFHQKNRSEVGGGESQKKQRWISFDSVVSGVCVGCSEIR